MFLLEFREEQIIKEIHALFDSDLTDKRIADNIYALQTELIEITHKMQQLNLFNIVPYGVV